MILYGNEILDNFICPLIKDNRIVFKTSGTTGEPKEISHDLKDFLKRYEADRPGYRTLITLDLSKLGGVDSLLHVYFYGGIAVIPETKNPEKILELLELHNIELLITSPSMLRFMLMYDVEKYNLSHLKIISYGSEKMPSDVLHSLEEVFPGVKLKQTYGLTEIGTLRTHSEGEFIKILDRAYKVDNGLLYILTEDGWLCTGDIVEQHGKFLKILGRESNVINVGGYKVQAEEVEEVLLHICKDALVYGEKNNLIGTIVVADVVSDKRKENILEYCKAKLDKYKIPMKFNYVAGIEYTEAGKKKRK